MKDVPCIECKNVKIDRVFFISFIYLNMIRETSKTYMLYREKLLKSSNRNLNLRNIAYKRLRKT